MVLYYSATGNTEFIAKQIADRLDDQCLNLLERIRTGDVTPIRSRKPFVVCSPVYVCEMPGFLTDYLKKVKLSGNRKVYFIFTSGGYTGIAGPLAKQIMRHKQKVYMGRAEFKMPRNYLASEYYPMLSPEENKKRIRASYDKIPEVAERILQRKKLRARHVFLFELLITLPFHPLWTKYKQPATPFRATNKCISCGKCEKVCPLNNIVMLYNKPAWKKNCAHCMACIENCPVDAIEYGERTEGKERYRISKYVKRFTGELEWKQ